MDDLVALLTLVLLLLAVITDLRTRTIPDSVSIAMVILAVLASWLGWHGVTFTQLGLGLGAGFAIGAALFYLGAMGGGDAKLAAGLGAICGLSRLLEVLFATALWGGVVSLIAKRKGEQSLPYAPAIALGYLSTLTIARILPPAEGLWTLITENAP